jgi:hypothetical protein
MARCGLGGYPGPRLLRLCVLACLLGVTVAASIMTVLIGLYYGFHIGTIMDLVQDPSR